MILERVEKDNLVNVIYESSNIVASTYDKARGDLNVIFKNGGSYTYQNVPSTDYFRFETADSQGKEINKTIKKYSFLKHEKVNTDDVIKKIKTLKNDEIKSLEVGLVSLMKKTIDDYESNVKLVDHDIEKLNKMINLLINAKK
tara:strand:+ start:801 stop:1229 length:429 start_codon:yes stop_codon:yes gene_type:complete